MDDLALVCGATGALGVAIVDAFVKRGDHVVAVARSRAEVSALESRYPRTEGAGFVTGDTGEIGRAHV